MNPRNIVQDELSLSGDLKISRRRILGLLAASGALSIAGSSSASAQDGGPVEFDEIISGETEVDDLDLEDLTGDLVNRDEPIENIASDLLVGDEAGSAGSLHLDTESSEDLDHVYYANNGSWENGGPLQYTHESGNTTTLTDEDIYVSDEGDWMSLADAASIQMYQYGSDDETYRRDMLFGSPQLQFSQNTHITGYEQYLDIDSTEAQIFLAEIEFSGTGSQDYDIVHVEELDTNPSTEFHGKEKLDGDFEAHANQWYTIGIAVEGYQTIYYESGVSSQITTDWGVIPNAYVNSDVNEPDYPMEVGDSGVSGQGNDGLVPYFKIWVNY